MAGIEIEQPIADLPLTAFAPEPPHARCPVSPTSPATPCGTSAARTAWQTGHSWRSTPEIVAVNQLQAEEVQ